MAPQAVSPEALLRDMADIIWRDDAAARQRVAMGAGPVAARTLAGLQIHANTTHVTLERALADAAPSVASALSSDRFSALAQAFIAQHPPTCAALHEWGDAFPDFLARWPEAAELIGLARMDRAWLAAFFAADVEPVGAACLTALSPAGILGARLGTHPSLQLVRLDGPWFGSWLAKAAVPQVESRCQAKADGSLVAFLRPQARVRAIALSPASFECLASLHAGNPLLRAFEHGLGKDPGFDLQENLSALFADGVFTDCLIEEQVR